MDTLVYIAEREAPKKLVKELIKGMIKRCQNPRFATLGA